MGSVFESPRARVGEKGYFDSVSGVCLDALPQSQANNPVFVIVQWLCRVDAHAPRWCEYDALAVTTLCITKKRCSLVYAIAGESE